MKFCSEVALAAAIGIVGYPAFAQDAGRGGGAGADPAAETGYADDVIVVTAQRRAENLQNVPIAVSVISNEQMDRGGATDVLDLGTQVPNLNLTSTAGYLSTSLRGIGSTGIGSAVENPVALYVDGVYIASGASILTLNNIEQVEVLRGPQGTLFGRNATGGLIQIRTRTPGQALTGRLNLSYANYDTVSGNAYIGGGLANDLVADIAVSATRQGDGWGKNRFNGEDVYRINHDVAVRSKIVYTPGSDTKLTLIGDYSDRVDSMNPYYVLPGTVPGVVVPPDVTVVDPLPNMGYDVNTDVQQRTATEAAGVSLQWNQGLGAVDLMSLTAYRWSSFDNNFDYDYTAYPDRRIRFVQDDRQFSQEFQLSSANSGPLTWVVGAYYFNAVSKYKPFLIWADGMGTNITLHTFQRTESIAGYAQASYALTDRTSLTLGGRYTTERRSTRHATQHVYIAPLDLDLGVDTFADRKATFDKFTYRVSLDHRFSDQVLAYASVNRGFKSGGFDSPQFTAPPYRPEVLDAYEVGLKTNFLHNRIRLNMAGFYYDYADIQVQKLVAGATTIINGAGARIYGLDVDFAARVSDSFTLTAGLGLLDTKYASFPECPISTPGGGVPTYTGDCAGKELPLASEITFSLDADYEVALGNGTLTLNGNLYYSSGFHPQSDNVLLQPDYALLGASARYRLDSGISFGVFGRNLTNRRVISQGIAGDDGTQTGFYRAPRTYGVQVGYEF